jgi:hypothetical protein
MFKYMKLNHGSLTVHSNYITLNYTFFTFKVFIIFIAINFHSH